MATLKTLLWVVFILFVIAISILFSLQNSTPVALDLLVVSMPPLPMSLWILVSFVLGALLGMLVSGLVILRLRSSNHRLQRKLQKMDSERAEAVSETHASSAQVVSVYQ